MQKLPQLEVLLEKLTADIDSMIRLNGQCWEPGRHLELSALCIIDAHIKAEYGRYLIAPDSVDEHDNFMRSNKRVLDLAIRGDLGLPAQEKSLFGSISLFGNTTSIPTRKPKEVIMGLFTFFSKTESLEKARLPVISSWQEIENIAPS